jgi:hypothetical protein
MGTILHSPGQAARAQSSRIAHKGVESTEQLGHYDGVVERTQAWLGRLGVRYEHRAAIIGRSWISAASSAAGTSSSADFDECSQPCATESPSDTTAHQPR